MRWSLLNAIVLAVCTNSIGWSADLSGQIAKQLGKSIGSSGSRALSKQAIQTTKAVASKASAQNIGKTGRSLAQQSGNIRQIASHQTENVMGFAESTLSESLQISAQNARRLSMLTPELAEAGELHAVHSLIAKGGKGDEIIDFLWRNKGTLAGSALLATAVANPEAVFESGEKIIVKAVEVSGEHIARPAVETAMADVVAPIVGGSAIRFWLLIYLGYVGLMVVLGISGRYGLWRRVRQLVKSRPR